MQNIFKALREDHDKQRKLMERLIETSGDSVERKEIFRELKEELEKHSKFEERIFYRPLLSHNMTQDHARHGIAEHKGIDDKIEELVATDFSSTGWLTLAKTLQHKVEHHLKEEEHGIFQLAGKKLSEEEKREFAILYNQEMNRNVKTRA